MTPSADVSEQDKAPWRGRIDRCLTAIAAWEERTTVGVPEMPEPTSRLAGDDNRHRQFPPSGVVWASICMAVDHLALLREAVTSPTGIGLRPHAHAAVCRSALVAAGQAIWVMSGTREQRLRRIRLLELDERNAVVQFVRDYTRDEEQLRADTSDAMVAAMRKQVDRFEARKKEIRASMSPKPKDREAAVTTILRDAAKVIFDKAGPDLEWQRRALMFEWRVASAEAHGRLWQRDLRPGSKTPLPDGSGMIHSVHATLQTFGQSLAVATLATSVAWRLWDEQRVARPDGEPRERTPKP